MKKYIFGSLVTLLLSTFSPSLALAKDYFVSNTGSDTAAGTLAAPFKTIDRGILLALPGDIVYVRAGTYPAFNVNKSGTSTALITVSGYNNEYPKIVGGGPTIKTYQRSYVVINGFEVTGSTSGGGIRADQSSYITISNNKVHDNFGVSLNGIQLLRTANSKVLNNIVYNNTSSGITNYGIEAINNEIAYNTVYNHTLSTGNSDGIGCNGEAINLNIHHNTVYGNSDDGIDTWSCTHNTIAYNIVHNNGGTGDGNGIKSGGLPLGGYNLVTHNISYNNYSDGITGNGSGGNKFINNVTYGNAHDGIGDGWRNNFIDTTSYINNISFNNARYDVSMSSGYVGVSHNNLWGKATWNYNGTMTLAQFYTASGFDNPSAGSLSSITGDPMFVNPASADFHLQSISKACTAGENGSYLGVYPCSTIVVPSPTPSPVIDATVPVVTITSPKTDATVKRSTKVTISATATDNVGITKLEYYVNNSLKCSSTTVKSCSWSVPSSRGVTYTILVKAYDKAGNMGSSLITVKSGR